MNAALAVEMKTDEKICKAKDCGFKVYDGGYKPKYRKNGELKKTHSNAPKGKSCEVYPLKDMDEIEKVIKVFDKHIRESYGYDKKIAWRNKLMFVIGINVGIRASDMRELKWSFFFVESERFRKEYKIQPKKTQKYNKFVTLRFNDTVKKVIKQYTSLYPIENMDDYIFFSAEADTPITRERMWQVIKRTCKEAGIEQNIGTHTMRKTFCYWAWHKAEDKQKALVILQHLLNHSNQRTTMKYIGIMDDEIEEMYQDTNLGFDFI